MPKLLLVDDDAEILDALADALSLHFEVRTASGVTQAFALLREGQVPDVIVTDYNMPPNRGDRLLLAVAVLFPWVGRVLHSASSQQELKAASVWAHQVLQKGCALPVLLTAIRQSLLEVRR